MTIDPEGLLLDPLSEMCYNRDIETKEHQNA